MELTNQEKTQMKKDIESIIEKSEENDLLGYFDKVDSEGITYTIENYYFDFMELVEFNQYEKLPYYLAKTFYKELSYTIDNYYYEKFLRNRK